MSGVQMIRFKQFRCIKTLDMGEPWGVAFTEGEVYYRYIEDDQGWETLSIFQNDYGTPHGMTSKDMMEYFEEVK